ncbi:MAG: translation elongation factor 4 [Floccifex porci]|uniref:Elongation factor 4 n=1 Tax=Floccifex porci TaxID=2606629 RepID=A0A7X2T325_9FIRM|nr:translation elongation factor 4 [Floccifex porci]MCI7801867.1 translation elongation factor 4 [Erysipelotrichaceae bacterium]MDD7467413.1 translation elongation factor 4 [Floccifex porci]MDO4480712.1 translation elongation factor 4 [Erysipelotrichaceae bacterium]MDY4797009.1 translation elongation factor 4 [Floccifex porci]MSS00588.1 elongation factor 4 [Floccifex porci]
MDQSHIRNFSIVAHIDHGKSTLADRILELTDTVEKREMVSQMLDTMDLERERGITIKLNAVQLIYHAKNGEDYLFHLIDTPGHVDFSYEVSRSLAACEGAVLVVDAAQGVQAQTLANVYLALDNDLEILPVLNKVDLPSAQPDVVKEEIENLIGLDCSQAVEISAKSGLNVDKVLEEIVDKLPAPSGDANAPLQALVFDSFYDSYRGIIAFVSVKNGVLKPKDKIRFMATGAEYEVIEVGVRTPKEVIKDQLTTGEVGWISAAIKNIEDVRVGDTITHVNTPAKEPLKGYREMNPMVYCGLYPVDNARYDDLKEALSKLKLNDASLQFEPETSQALGFGFRCGFLGLLHMDVVEERLEREFNLDLIATSPSVIYHVFKTDGTMEAIDNPAALPPAQNIDHIEEPYVSAEIMVPKEYVGAMMDLCQKKRGEYVDLQVLDDIRMLMKYELPLSEIIFDFFDKMKSCTKGYASLDYEISGYRESKLVKMDILLNGQIIDALSTIVYKDFAYHRGNAMTIKLKEIIPKQQFEIPVQAAIGGKVIARTNIKALRKNVLAKCYGGDISRKKKLLEKQKEGKKRMKMVGSVEIPQEAFMAVLSMDED